MKGTMPLYTTIMDAATVPGLYQERNLPNGPKLSLVIRESVPFEISNLVLKNEVSYFGKQFVDMFRDLPPCVPPYRHTWFEFSYLNEPIAMSLSTVKRIEADDQFWRNAADPVVHEVPLGGFLTRGVVIRGAYIASVAQMLVLCEAVFNSDGSIKIDDGGPLVNRFMPTAWLATLSRPYTEEEQRAECEFALTCFYDCLFACALLHCKNVKQVDDYLPRPLARARKQRKLPPIIFKTLVVDPGRTPRKSHPGEGDKIQKRQHIVRGHFAEYGWNKDTGDWFRWPDGTPKGKLFGRLDGRFWIPEMVKGDSETGFVVKEYRIKGGTL